MRIHQSLILIAAVTLVTATAHGATSTPGAKSSNSHATSATNTVESDVPTRLAKEAKISLGSARSTALSRVKGGSVRSEELEREHGKLIYSFDIAVPGKSGVTEVNVDAKSGKVLNVRHESPASEKREAAKEGKSKPPGHR